LLKDAVRRACLASPAFTRAAAVFQGRRRASGISHYIERMRTQTLNSPVSASVVLLAAQVGEQFVAGQLLLVIEAMKMEHEMRAEQSGVVTSVHVAAGDRVQAGDALIAWESTDLSALVPDALRHRSAVESCEAARTDDALRELQTRLSYTLDAQRPEAMSKRHGLGLRSARENIEDLCDPGSFAEYGALAIAAQTQRRSLDDLLKNTPADGMVTGLASVNGHLFPGDVSRCAVMAYDATVLAGTQGMRNHQKTDRLLQIAAQQKLPVVLFAEGGGGRPGDSDMPVVAGLHVGTFASFARLNGLVPLIGIVAGRCFAGNAALLGCCDVVIATRDSNIGMGGPAMVEGGGLGVFRPEDIGPSNVQQRSGVIDVLVDNEADAVVVAKKYLAFFQGRVPSSSAADPQLLRTALPENRVRSYDMRIVMKLVIDADSLLELRAGFGAGIFTALARIDGRPIGLMASNPQHVGGAIDADAADKAARFMQLCNAYGLPLVSLVDTTGFMVGPDAEAQGQVRHVSRMFIAAAHLRVPFFAVVLRKAYGLGAMAMTGGGFHVPVSTVAWPSGEFGAMGLEGAVRLGYRKELAALAEGAERDALFQSLLDQQIAAGKAINMASTLEIDAVIDPADTRAWLLRGLLSVPSALSRAAPTAMIDAW
jgi:acetyl-CoA carboxylase carboxyltransferase component/biotin carboxyl carrier protein